MKGICPNCEKETTLERVSIEEVISVRRGDITVPVELFRCSECGEDFEDASSKEAQVESAYREYRKRLNLLQPEEIKNFRSRFGLTQSELGKLLGFGGASISRYENGALQDDTHDNALRLAMHPNNLLRLIEKFPDAISDAKRSELTARLRDEDMCSSFRTHLERLSSYKADHLCGFKEFDFAKFLSAVLLFCKAGTFTTVLNKLLFYGDFLHYKEFSVSITGLRYAHMTYGPAPDKYHTFFASLIEDELLNTEEVVFNNGGGERFWSSAKPDIEIFEESELRCLLHVKAKFGKSTATEVSDYSHKESAYKETKNGELITYTLAENLSLGLE